jgi:integrase
MNLQTSEFLEQAKAVFQQTSSLTLLDIRKLVELEAPCVRRRDALSAFAAIGKLFDQDISDIPSKPETLRDLFAGHNGPEFGISHKRFANIRSSIKCAVDKYVPRPTPITKRIPLAPKWLALTRPIPDRDYASSVNRLACFCTVMGISPEEVGRDILLGYHAALVAEEVVKDPRRILNLGISYWNHCQRNVKGWPNITLSSPFPRKIVALPIDLFAGSFNRDVQAFKDRLSGTNLFDQDGPAKSLRPRTIDHRVKQIYRFASRLVGAGYLELSQLHHLSDLVQFELVKNGLTLLLNGATSKPPPSVVQYAQLMASIGRYHCKLPVPQCEELKALVQKLARYRERGMTGKNRSLLRQVDEERDVRALMALSDDERRRGKIQTNPYRQAKFFERALVLDLLIYASPRMKNLCTLHLDRNIVWRGLIVSLSFPADEMKNGQSLELDLPKHVSAHLKEFLRVYRPRIEGAEGKYLFPGMKGPKHPSTIRTELQRMVWKHLGMKVHPHLFRHITTKWALQRDPSLLPLCSQRLGHKSTQTLMDFYADNATRAASREMNRVLEQRTRKGSK